MKKLTALFKLLRPHQWIKNAFVFVGVLFSHDWQNFYLMGYATIAAIAFCFISSAVYIYNDIIDYPEDRLHPTKKNRPLANGSITSRYALLISSLLFIIAIGLGLYVSPKIILILLGYLMLNIFYTHLLKNIVILDVFAISSGFMLRILAGTWGIGILPSQWLMFCGLMITLFLGFAKRRAESFAVADKNITTRKVLKEYHTVFLDKMIGITAGCSVIGYGLYTMSPVTVATHHTQNLIYTIPFVIYGIFRYLYLLHTSARAGQDTAKDLFRDKHLLVTLLLWFIVTMAFIA